MSACLIVLCIFSVVACATYPSTSGGGNTKITSIATSESEARLSRSTVVAIIQEYLSRGGYFIDTKKSYAPTCDPLIDLKADAIKFIQDGILTRDTLNMETAPTYYSTLKTVFGEMLAQNYHEICTMFIYTDSQRDITRYVIWVPPNCYPFALDLVGNQDPKTDLAIDEYRQEQLLLNMTFQIVNSPENDDWLGNWQVFWDPPDSEGYSWFIVDDTNHSVIHSSINTTMCDF